MRIFTNFSFLRALMMALCTSQALAAQAFPGASGDDFKETLKLRSSCEEGTDIHHTDIFLYEEPGVTTQRGYCPLGFALQIKARPTAVASLEKALAEGHEALASGHSWGQKAFRMHYVVRVMKYGAALMTHSLSNADHSTMMAHIKTLSATHPVTAVIDYRERKIQSLTSDPESPSRKILAIVATCLEISKSDWTDQPAPSAKEGQSVVKTEKTPSRLDDVGILDVARVRAYSRTDIPRTAEICPPDFQLTFIHGKEKVEQSKFYNFVETSGDFKPPEYFYRSNRLQILSRFGNPIFSQQISPARKKQIVLDLTTARPDTPVQVVIDTSAKVVLDIKPSVSPFAY